MSHLLCVRFYAIIITTALCSLTRTVSRHTMSASKVNTSLSRLGSIRSSKYQSTGSVGELGETVSLYKATPYEHLAEQEEQVVSKSQ